VSQPKRALLLFLLAIALAAWACRSPAPPHEGPSTSALAAPEAERTNPGLAIRRAPSVPSEAVAEDPGLALVRSLLGARATRVAPPQRERLAETLVEVERESGISALLLVALIEQESRFDPLAKGPRGSLGLMQVRPFVGEDFAARNGIPWQGTRTLLDPVENVRIGAGYLVELLERFGSQELALAAYNMGPTRLDRRLARGDARIPAFVRRVLRDYEGLQREFASTQIGIGG
jgi:soluble lytic murein transglycosylase-like protein